MRAMTISPNRIRPPPEPWGGAPPTGSQLRISFSADLELVARSVVKAPPAFRAVSLWESLPIRGSLVNIMEPRFRLTNIFGLQPRQLVRVTRCAT